MSLFRRPKHLPPVPLITAYLPRTTTVRITARIVSITPCAGGFAVRYTRAGHKAEHVTHLDCAPLPPGANEYLARVGKTCGLRLDGRRIVEVYP